MYLRPKELADRVIDFASFTDGFIGVNVELGASDKAFQFNVAKSGDSVYNPNMTIGQNGTQTTDYSVMKQDENVRSYYFKRLINGAGSYNDVLNYYSKAILLSPDDPLYNQPRPNLNLSASYSYFIFQESVAVVKIDTTLIQQNMLVTTDTETSFTIDGSSSRGYERGYALSIYRRNELNDWELATLGIDYSLTIGEINLTHNVQFLIAAEFKIIVTVTGYDSTNNDFGFSYEQRQLVTENYDKFTFYVNSGVSVSDEDITLPEIEAVVYPMSSLSTESEVTQTYTNSDIIITPDVKFETGIWVVNEVPRFPTNDEWLNEISNAASVRLHVLDENDNDVVPPMSGLQSHVVKIPSVGTFNFKFITTLR